MRASRRSPAIDAVSPVLRSRWALKLLGALEVEKECRELLYAARMLPEWLYAPRLTFPRLFEPVPKRDPRG